MQNSFFSKFYRFIESTGSNLQSLFLLLLRLYWGGSFMFAGWGKLMDIHPVVQFFTSLNIPFPHVSAYLVSLVELIGGICLILGLGSRLAALALVVVMLGAIYTTNDHLAEKIVNDTTSFITQLPFVYLLVSLVIFIFGAGKISLDYLYEKRVLRR